MLTLHHAPRSRSSRIIWLLEELNTEYAIKITDIARMDGPGAADPANPHPDKKVPALTDDGVVVTESVAIILYLTDKLPRAELAPTVGDPKRGAYLTWLAYYAGVIEPVVTTSFAGIDHPAVQRSWGGRASVDARILGALHASPYMLGETFTAVDILIASMGHWSRQMLPADTIVDEFLKRCGERPALARAQAKDNG